MGEEKWLLDERDELKAELADAESRLATAEARIAELEGALREERLRNPMNAKAKEEPGFIMWDESDAAAPPQEAEDG